MPSFINSPVIHSVQQPLVKQATALQQAKYRREYGLLLCEGVHVVQEALNTQQTFCDVFVLESRLESQNPKGELTQLLQNLAKLNGVSIHQVSEIVMKKITTLENNPPLVATIKAPESGESHFCAQVSKRSQHPLLLVLADIQDPGNAGTLIRSLVAFGGHGILATQHTVDLYSPKVLRSSAGLIFHLPVYRSDTDLPDLLEKPLKTHFPSLHTIAATGQAASAKETQDIHLRNYKHPHWVKPYQEAVALIVGNEGHGIEALLSQSVPLQKERIQWISIDMAKGIDSLNVSISGSIILAEIAAARKLPRESS